MKTLINKYLRLSIITFIISINIAALFKSAFSQTYLNDDVEVPVFGYTHEPLLSIFFGILAKLPPLLVFQKVCLLISKIQNTHNANFLVTNNQTPDRRSIIPVIFHLKLPDSFPKIQTHLFLYNKILLKNIYNPVAQQQDSIQV